jgi:hypothetical protein
MPRPFGLRYITYLHFLATHWRAFLRFISFRNMVKLHKAILHNSPLALWQVNKGFLMKSSEVGRELLGEPSEMSLENYER